VGWEGGVDGWPGFAGGVLEPTLREQPDRSSAISATIKTNFPCTLSIVVPPQFNERSIEHYDCYLSVLVPEQAAGPLRFRVSGSLSSPRSSGASGGRSSAACT
jgi:hypothetical protein